MDLLGRSRLWGFGVGVVGLRVCGVYELGGLGLGSNFDSYVSGTPLVDTVPEAFGSSHIIVIV